MDWKRKLTSRKFWMALAMFISGLIVAFGGAQDHADRVLGCIMQGAAVVAYIIGEGLVDQENCGWYTPETSEPKEEDKVDK